MKRRLIAPVLALALLTAGCGPSGDSSPGEAPATEVQTTGEETASDVVAAPPSVIGMTLDAATSELEAAGVAEVTSEDVRDGKSIWNESNWTVVEQRSDGAAVWLGVEKPEAPEPVATTPVTEDALELSADDERFIKVLALQMTLVDSPEKQALCDGYGMLGAELTADAINQEVDLENQFPADVVREVFDENC